MHIDTFTLCTLGGRTLRKIAPFMDIVEIKRYFSLACARPVIDIPIAGSG